MKSLSVSKDGTRLLLVVPNSTPLRAAAQAIPGVQREGVQGDLVAFSFPANPDNCMALLETFEPGVGKAHEGTVLELTSRYVMLEEALAEKYLTSECLFDHQLTTAPMSHQVGALNYCAARFDAGAKGTALLMEQGTGKSLVAAGMANKLHADGDIGWVMVLCPNSLKGTWGAVDGEILKHNGRGTQYPVVLRGDRDKKQAHLQRVLNNRLGRDYLPWVITNFDEFAVDIRNGSNADRFRHTLDIIKAAEPALLVVDESSSCKNWKAKRTKAVMALSQAFPFRLILTGTPVECSPLDIWPQFEILEPGCLGYKSALAFEKAHAVYERRMV
ncbi:hypothetical protein LCGC14_3075100, partial [marine sediment metagenome]